LLSHRSGLRDYFQPKNRAAIHAARSATDLLPLALADGVAFPPGTGQAYSNSGFVVLGAIVERLSGLTYPDYLRRFVFAPAGMVSTSLDESAPRAVPMTRMALPGPGAAAPGDAAATGARRAAPGIGPRRGTPAGGATSTVGDLFRFAEALRKNRLTRPATTEMLWRIHMIPPGKGRPGEKESYGYGFNRVDIGGARMLGHGGGSIGVNAQFEIYPETARVVAALSNYDPPAATEAVRAARRTFLGGDPAAICAAPS
jgi:CubicO group peptidase (beta-lactamase class C family)